MLQLMNGTKYAIPSSLLYKCPKLVALSRWSQTVSLEIHEEVMHTLVHYLFTDTYQSLKPKGSSFYDKLTSEFATSVRVYVLARDLESSPLEKLAKFEIQRLGNVLRFPTILEQVRKAYPNPMIDDAWFSSYLKARLKIIFQSQSELLACCVSDTERPTLSVSDLLLKNFVELVLHDREISPQVLDTNPDVMASKLVSPREESLNPDESSLSVECDRELTPEGEPEGPESQYDVSTVTLKFTSAYFERETEPPANPGPESKKNYENWSQGDAYGTEPQPDLEPDLEPVMEAKPNEEEDDGWGFAVSKKKCKRCKKMRRCKNCKALEPAPVSEVVAEPWLEKKEEDIWSTPPSKEKCKEWKE